MTLVQYRCAHCQRCTPPVEAGQPAEPGPLQDHVEGCWVVDGGVCPECQKDLAHAEA